MSGNGEPVEVTDLEASILRMIRGGGDPWAYCRQTGAHSRVVSQAVRRLQRKLLADPVQGSAEWTATPLGREALAHYDDTKHDHYP